MKETARKIGQAVIVGMGATAAMDATAEILRRCCGTQSLDYSLLGRWLGHMRRGRFRHASITAAAPVPNERAAGWAAHYAIGSGFAVALVVVDSDWLDDPKLLPAVTTGLVTTAAPWFVMQPAFGMGVAASKTPRPGHALLGTLRTHTVYGAGLWISAVALKQVRDRFTA